MTREITSRQFMLIEGNDDDTCTVTICVDLDGVEEEATMVVALSIQNLVELLSDDFSTYETSEMIREKMTFIPDSLED